MGGLGQRAYSVTRSSVQEIGDMMVLTGKTLVSAIRPPYPYGNEFVLQFLFAMRLCWFPMLLSTVAFGYEAPGLQAANFLVSSCSGRWMASWRVLRARLDHVEFAPFVDAIVVAGVAGTAITADLGARKIREELDALVVMGVDPIKILVVPWFLALMIVTGLFDIYALLFGIFGGVLATLVNHAPLGPFFATLGNNAEPTDLWASVVKATLFGAVIAIVCCYKGMNASGGAATAFGRAVNQAVVIAFLGIFAFNYTFTQVLLATHPAITTIAKRFGEDNRRSRMSDWLEDPQGWLISSGQMLKFIGAVIRDVFNLRVIRFLGEALRQAGILIVSSTRS